MAGYTVNRFNWIALPGNSARPVMFIRARRSLPLTGNSTPLLADATIWCAMQSKPIPIWPFSIYLPVSVAASILSPGGELQRVLKAGGDPQKVVFSGVGKQPDEMRAALAAGILCFNVESEAELAVLNQVAGEMNKIAPVSLRVNPDVDARTHPYISTGLKENKFGIPFDEAEKLYASVTRICQLTH